MRFTFGTSSGPVVISDFRAGDFYYITFRFFTYEIYVWHKFRAGIFWSITFRFFTYEISVWPSSGLGHFEPQVQVQGWLIWVQGEFTWAPSSGLVHLTFKFRAGIFFIYNVSIVYLWDLRELQVQGWFIWASSSGSVPHELQVQGWDYIFFYNVSIVYLWDSRESQSVGLQGKSVSQLVWLQGKVMEDLIIYIQ